MFATFKQIFRSSNKDLRTRILFTLGVLFIFALGNSITIPGMDVIKGDIGFLELFNALSGGGLKQFSIFALGVMPYISASIIIQILQMDIIPYFSELKDMGEEGRRKIAGSFAKYNSWRKAEDIKVSVEGLGKQGRICT